MAALLKLEESDVRQEFVLENILFEVCATPSAGAAETETAHTISGTWDLAGQHTLLSSSQQGLDAAPAGVTTLSSGHSSDSKDVDGANAGGTQLSPFFAGLLERYMAATSTSDGEQSTAVKGKGSSRRSKAVKGSNAVEQVSAAAEVMQELQAQFSQLLNDYYREVEQEDVAAFSHKLLTGLHQLVQDALQQQADAEGMDGLCALCGRDMPLTKHHLIPRDVHKEFKKRGFSFAELQSGVMVCRPCHSAIHRAVPDNKQLGLHYQTLEALTKHEEIAKFAAWANRQRVSSKVNATSKHFKYRR
eukprot:GHRR01011803.1.p1 GENE.GHRR01011803.1~~GHRR01011803.1.p1  ORF type:complete len:303 (+),score=130.43 GHRR01011803.1:522-1430(+)